MKVITITAGNINYVYGRLKKFFYNRNRTGFLSWHNFDCGFKKHIDPNIYLETDGNKVPTFHEYPSPDDVKLVKNGEYSYIVMHLMPGYGSSLKCGDKIAFCGNRIITRSEFFFDHKYIYSVMQVLPMNESKQRKMRSYAEMEEAAYEEDYYDNY